MTQTIHNVDVLIAGGGMVGMSLAIALARAHVRVGLVDKQPLATHLLPEFDGRVSAIAISSKHMLSAIGVWEHMQAYAEPIKDIRVADDHSSSFVHYDHEEVGHDPFGYIVENRITRQAMQKTAATILRLTFFTPSEITSLQRDEDSVTATLSTGEKIRAALLIAAEGKHSPLREKTGIKVIRHDYQQTAIVCTIKHSKPHHGLALERFFPSGPFAVLPMQDNRSSLVWVERNPRAEAFLSLPEKECAEEIHARVGSYLGEIELAGPRFSYPLDYSLATRYTDTRFALAGDAAHSIHPIAGQGVNLGFRDAAVLAQLIREQKELGMDVGSALMLSHYERWRRFDNLTMLTVTDGLARLFSNNNGPLKIARRLGLKGVSALPPLKKLFMLHAMGLTGDLPYVMQGKAA